METQEVVKEVGSSFGLRPDFAKEKKVLKDLPSIRLSPEQIEEIHAANIPIIVRTDFSEIGRLSGM